MSKWANDMMFGIQIESLLYLSVVHFVCFEHYTIFWVSRWVIFCLLFKVSFYF